MSSQDRSIAPRDKVAAIDDDAVWAKRLVVPDNLAAMRLLTQENQQEQETVVSAQRFFDVASVRYKTGLGPYLHVFTAQAGLLANQLTVITLRVQQMTSSVQLIESWAAGGCYPAPDRTAGPIFTVLWPFLTQDMRPLTNINVP